MKKKFSISSKEIKHLIIATLILGIIFGFNDRQPTFEPSFWITNFISTLLLSAVIVLTTIIGYKIAANLFRSKISFELWSIKRFGLKKTSKFKNKFYLGSILAILIMLLSLGKFFFTAISTFTVEETKKLGKRYESLTHKEEAAIAASGILFNVILIAIFKILNIEFGMIMGSWFIAWHLLPFSDLPGGKIFFGAILLYIFLIAFVVIFLLLIPISSIIASIVWALLAGISLVLIYSYYTNR
ncbi:hypothetical protein K8R47_01285 [archaeon]|nr:hypothetical protein [archaeon]